MVVVPALIPATTPVGLTLAIAELLLLQTPPGTIFDNTVIEPVQMLPEPVIDPADGAAVTVMVSRAAAVPQLLVTA